MEVECEKEVYFTTSQKNHVEEYNSISDLPISISSIKAEDTNDEKTSVHKYGIHIMDDICENELDKVDPLMLSDTKPDSIGNVNVCKSEADEGDNTFNWEESKFGIGEENGSLFVEGKCMKEGIADYHDEEIPTIKTEETNEINLTDMDLKYPAKDEDADSRSTGRNLILPDLTTINEKQSVIMCAGEIVDGNPQYHHAIETMPICYIINKNQFKTNNEYILLQGNQCNIIFIQDTQFREQLSYKEKHPLECPHCSKIFTRSGHLKDHLRAHKGIRSHQCPQCKKRFVQASKLKIHLRIHVGIRPYECPQCNKRFNQGGALKRHLRFHEGIGPHKCPQCNMRFMLSATLVRHLRSHEGFHPYECPLCNERFAGGKTLNDHLKRHDEIRPYECPKCNATFALSATLKRHLRCHELICSYACPMCSETFALRATLKMHLRSHKEIRLYECPKCNAAFALSATLKRHLRCHDEIRPYKCHQCSMKFTQSENLKLHLETH